MSRTIPDWPRLMRRDLAAAYCDMPIAEFERGVATGALPQPVKVVDRDRWSKAALDERVGRLTGEGGDDDFRKRSKLYAA
jgi:hypothetical protein